MERLFVAFSLTILFSFNAEANRYFQRVPLSEAHLSFGRGLTRSLDAQSINLLIWNIKKASEPDWQKEFTQYGKDKDIFIIQEAYPNPLFNLTLASLGEYQWEMGISFRYVLYDYLPTGTMIGSEATPENFIVTHSPDVELITETPKAVTYATYQLDNHEEQILVANIHAVNFTEFAPFERHMLQIEEEIKKHSGPVIIAGDFNTRTKDRIRYMYEMMKRLGMAEVDFKNGNMRMRAKMTNNILDYAFVRGLKIKTAEVMGHAKGSDHKPMLIELSLK